MVYKRAETAGTCPINNSSQNPVAFSPSCQEYINKVIFVWVYKLENYQNSWNKISTMLKHAAEIPSVLLKNLKNIQMKMPKNFLYVINVQLKTVLSLAKMKKVKLFTEKES